MIKPSRVGHATFETPDLDKALAYYTEVNGMVLHAREKDRAYLASKTGLLTLALERGSQENLKRISFEMAPTADFADLAQKARDNKISVADLQGGLRGPARSHNGLVRDLHDAGHFFAKPFDGLFSFRHGY